MAFAHYGIVFFLASIAFFGLSYWRLKSVDVYLDITKPDDCESLGNPGDTCKSWDKNNKICRKGKVNDAGTECVANSDVWPLVFIVIGGVCLFTSIYFAFKKKKK